MKKFPIPHVIIRNCIIFIMRVVVQRVRNAEVSVGGKLISRIGKGALIFLGVGKSDTTQDADYLADKVLRLRMFEDEAGKMNLSLFNIGAEALVVSQFTLYGDCRKGRRPSFDKAAAPQEAERLYSYFINCMRGYGVKVEEGRFRAMMDVSLVNDGPVTFILESR